MAVFSHDTHTSEYIRNDTSFIIDHSTRMTHAPANIFTGHNATVDALTRMTHAPANIFSKSDEYQCAHGLICVQFTLPSVSDAEKIQSYSYFLDFRTPSRP